MRNAEILSNWVPTFAHTHKCTHICTHTTVYAHALCSLVWLELHVHVLLASLTDECGLHQGALNKTYLWTHLQSSHAHFSAMLYHMWGCQQKAIFVLPITIVMFTRVFTVTVTHFTCFIHQFLSQTMQFLYIFHPIQSLQDELVKVVVKPLEEWFEQKCSLAQGLPQCQQLVIQSLIHLAAE